MSTTGSGRSTRAVARLRELVPDARYAVAHGQMSEGQLEQVMLDFWNREADVLVATTIIESGPRSAPGEHARRGAGRPARASPSSISCGDGSAGPASVPTPTCSTRRTSRSPRRRTAGSRRSVRPPTSGRGSSWRSATSRSGAPARSSARSNRGRSPRSASISTPRWWPMRYARWRGGRRRHPSRPRFGSSCRWWPICPPEYVG